MEGAKRPIGGVDYPLTFQEMDDWFARAVKRREYIRRFRWPAGFVCSRRGVTGYPWEMSRHGGHGRGKFREEGSPRCAIGKMTLAKSSPSCKSPRSNAPREYKPTYGRINIDRKK
ncbi:MAG: hypothetical protein DLM68_13475 [Hyphomicrobiales bacterium]|nr:MAG: hypothetical protein DLM68_13475 [Hyphomicrobiales bacterium]